MLSSCVYWLRNKINFEFLSSCHPCQFPTKLINGWVSVHETRFPKYNLFFFLHFWIGSYLWSIEGQALRWHHYSHNFAFFINNKNSMLLRVCRIRHHRRQNVVRTSLTFSSHVPLFFSYHILKSSVIYYWTDRWQHRIYLLSRKGIWFVDIVELPVSSVTTHECRIWAITNSGSSINAIFQSWCKPISFSRRENKR